MTSPKPSKDQLGTGFGVAAATYQRGRPDYPDDLVAWLVGDAGRIADVGAGTGKLTSTLRRLGHEVVAIDPDARMLETLRTAVGEVETHIGRAEQIPLPDGAVDAITFGQAWHWVDPEPASIEAARVLAPGGVLGLIWNIRDDAAAPWAAELTTMVAQSEAERMLAAGPPTVTAPFGPAEHRVHRWRRSMTVADVRDMVASRSHFIAAPPAEQQQVLARVTELVGSVADADGSVELPYRTEAFRHHIAD